MKRVLLACACVAACGALAQASGYDAFVNGLGVMDVSKDVAVSDFTAALADPGLLPSLRPVALYDRAEIYAHGGKDDLALADLDAALALRPDFDTYEARAALHMARNETDPAMADYGAAIALRPERAAGYSARAGALIAQEKFDAALADAQKAAEVAPDGLLPLLQMSMAHRLKGDAPAALADADKILDMTRRASPDGFLARAAVYEDGGDYDRALFEAGYALRLVPQDTMLLLNRAMLQWRAGHADDAAKTAREAADGDAVNPYAVLWLALARSEAKADNSDLGARVAKLDLDEWPGALVKLYQGQATMAAVKAQAEADLLRRRVDVCEANFYGAQYARLQGRPQDAAPLLDAAAGDCPPTSEERGMARRQKAAGEAK